MLISIKNWSKFQHYKDRTPPWIKLHKGLLNDRDYLALPIEGMAIAPLIWLLASDLSTTGQFEISLDDLAWRLRLDSDLLARGLQQLADKKFIDISDIPDLLADCKQDASAVLASCYPRDRGETEGETEGEAHPAKISFDPALQKFTGLDSYIPVWGKAFPSVCVELELMNAAAWLLADKKRVGSYKSWGRFLSNWLKRAATQSMPEKETAKPIDFSYNMLRGKD